MCETKEFKLWVRLQVGRDDASRAWVERETYPNKVKTEIRENGRWVEKNL